MNQLDEPADWATAALTGWQHIELILVNPKCYTHHFPLQGMIHQNGS